MNTKGFISTSILSGIEAQSQVSVSKSTELGMGLAITLSTQYGIASYSLRMSFNAKLTNTQSSTTTETSRNAVSSTLRVKPVIGNECKIKLHQETCSFTSDGSVPVVANGWVWFEFEKEVKGHKIWGYLLESTLSERERGVPVGLTAAISTTSYGNFESACECVEGPCEREMNRKRNHGDTSSDSNSGESSKKGTPSKPRRKVKVRRPAASGLSSKERPSNSESASSDTRHTPEPDSDVSPSKKQRVDTSE